MAIRRSRGAAELRARRARFHVLVATDGSRPGRAAVAQAVAFPWPPGSRASGIVARRSMLETPLSVEWAVSVRAALDRAAERVRADAERALARRWPHARVRLLDRTPVDAVLAEARRVRADAIVVGSRGHGLLGRLVLGSVSRGVVRGAGSPVLVVKGRPRPVRRLVLAIDGSPHARRAVELAAALRPPAGGQVTVIRVVEPARVPSTGLAPAGVRAAVAAQAAGLTSQREGAARQEVDAAVRRLGRAGWVARPVVRIGVPLPELLRARTAARADVLVVGARGAGGVARLLLGSVAEGALGRSPVSIFVVR